MQKILQVGLGKIEANKVGWLYCKTGHPSKVKSQITRAINEIIRKRNPKSIKIGKSGEFNSRRHGKDYLQYTSAEILYSSSSKSYVENIEGYYNQYVIQNYPEICKNVKKGSAGKLTEQSGRYVVYMVLS